MIGFIILNYCTWEKTIDCVSSICSTYKFKKKIIIVDNNSPNDSYNHLISYFKKNVDSEVDLIQTPKNGGFAYGNNIGIRRAIELGINYAIVTNNDIIFKDFAIERIFKELNKSDKIVMVGPKILNIKGNVISMPGKEHLSLPQFLGIKTTGYYKKDELLNNQKVYSISGACFGININKFVMMGAIDEGTFLYEEEIIMAMQAQKSDLSIVYLNNAIVIHNHGASTKPGLFSDGEMIKSSLFYWRKYEKANKYKLFFIWSFFVIKCFLKIMMRKVSGKGYIGLITSTFKKLLFEINNTKAVYNEE